MAEKYGTVPKLFTKKWWEFFWDYYKIHTITVVCIILATVITVYQINNSPKYDFYVAYLGEEYIEEEAELKLCEYISPSVVDLQENDEKLISFSQFVYKEHDKVTAQQNTAMISKFHLEFSQDNTILFIFNKSKSSLFDSYFQNKFFFDYKDWASDDISDDMLYKVGDSTCAVSLKNSKVLNELGVDCEDLYIAVRSFLKDEGNREKLETAKIVADLLIKSK